MEQLLELIRTQIKPRDASASNLYISPMINEEKRGTEGTKLGSWLDRLQQESWELELLISGFAIFLLLGGWQPYTELASYLEMLIDESAGYHFLGLAYSVNKVAYAALVACLMFHLVLRGVWIAAIGLRSVSGDIDYEALRYRQPYVKWLARSVGSFDGYIERLERYCSVLFTVAFLILFCFLSLSSYFLVTIGLKALYFGVVGGEWETTGVLGGGSWVELVMLVLGVIYFFDFATMGLLKRIRYVNRVYYPIYRLMGWISLAWIYRPLYHNLIDNRFGRRIAWFLPLMVLGFITIASFQIITHTYFPGYFGTGTVWIDHQNYDEENADRSGERWRVTLKSKYPEHQYIEAFVPYRSRYDDPAIERQFPDLAVGRYTGPLLRGGISLGKRYNADADYDSLLLAVASTVRLTLNDSLRQDLRPKFHYHPQREQPGLLYLIPTHELPVGEHFLHVDRRRIQADTLYWRDYGGIYFYK